MNTWSWPGRYLEVWTTEVDLRRYLEVWTTEVDLGSYLEVWTTEVDLGRYLEVWTTEVDLGRYLEVWTTKVDLGRYLEVWTTEVDLGRYLEVWTTEVNLGRYLEVWTTEVNPVFWVLKITISLRLLFFNSTDTCKLYWMWNGFNMLIRAFYLSLFSKMIVLFLNRNMCFGCSKEPYHWGCFFRHSTHMFELLDGKRLQSVNIGVKFIQNCFQNCVSISLKKHMFWVLNKECLIKTAL